MPKISVAELTKISEISHIGVLSNEQSSLQHQLEDVLTYAERVKEIAADTTCIMQAGTPNVVRPDIERPCNAQELIARAPQAAESYFVVPRVIEHK